VNAKLGDLTKAELQALIVDEVRRLIQAEVRQTVHQAMKEAGLQPVDETSAPYSAQGILALPTISLPPDHPANFLVRREEMYGDDGR
jgi:hypothetical protein